MQFYLILLAILHSIQHTVSADIRTFFPGANATCHLRILGFSPDNTPFARYVCNIRI